MTCISIDELTRYLNDTTGGFSCPICQHQHWQAEQKGGHEVSDVKLMTEGGLNDVFTNVIRDFGGTVPSSDGDKAVDSPILNHLTVIRCGYCGWVSLFDRAFIEDKIHGKYSA